MRNIMVLIIMVLCFSGIMRVNGNEKFLSGALDEDKSMQELSARVAELKDKQEESNVFSKGEIKSSTDTIERIDKVRDENIGAAISNLEKTVEDKIEEKGQYYDNAREEYEKAVKNMHIIYEKQVKGLVDKKGDRELYDKQLLLLEELKKFQEDMNKKDNKATEDDLDKVAEMSEKQEEIKQETEDDDLQKKMDQANEDLKNMNIPEAIQKQQEIVDEMNQELDENSPDMDESQGANLEEMEQSINEMEQKLQDSMKDETQGMSDEERQKLAMKMSALAEEMKKQDSNAQAEKMEQAMMDVLQQQDKQALQQLQQAKQGMQQKKKQMAQAKKQQTPPNKSTLMDGQGESKPQASGALYGKKNEEVKGSGWKAALPVKERAALLAAQKAKYSPDMELSVRKYFKELAK